MRDRIVPRFVLMINVLLLGLSYACCVDNVFAVGEGGGYEGVGGQTGVYCDVGNSATYACAYGRNGVGGAAWKWYKWEPNVDLDKDGRNDTVEIPSYVNDKYPQVNLMGSSPYINGCGDVGGYWRYAYVAVRDGDSKHYLKYNNGTQKYFQKGDQVGLASIGSEYNTYRAEAFGGKMYYNSSLSDRSFDGVKAIYRYVQEEYPGSFSLGWSGTSSLSWFCAADPSSSSFQGDSGVLKGDNNTAWDDATEKVGTQTVSAAGESDVVRFSTECGDDGCDIDFRHYLKRTFGDGKTRYKIIREIVSGGSGIDAGVSEGEFPSQDIGERVLVRSNVVHMRPGDEVCETMEFSVNGRNDADSKARSKVCATVKGSLAGVEQESASISLQVRNEDVKRYSDYDSNTWIVRAKPGDTIEFRTTYDAAPQSAWRYFEDQNKNVIGIERNDWKNGFSVWADGFDYRKTTMYDPGVVDVSPVINKYEIKGSDVGKSLAESAAVNYWKSGSPFPTPTEYSVVGRDVNVEVNQLISVVKVGVPYNFDTSISVSDNGRSIMSAGEAVEDIKYDMKVEERSNSETADEGEKYKTLMRDVKIKSIVYIGDEKKGTSSYGGDNLCSYYMVSACSEEQEDEKDKVEDTESDFMRKIVVPDVPAGTRICVAAAVYPANSGGAINLDKRGSDTWRISDSKCYPVAKKPSVQVWGGNVAANTISAPFANKKLDDILRLFGSWGELAVASGNNDTMVSGAAWGYASNNDGALQPNLYSTINSGNPGGGTMGTGCDSSILSFGSGCGLLGSISGGSGEMDAGDISKIAEQVEKKIGIAEDANSLVYVVDEINLGEDEFVNKVRYFKNNGDIDIKSDVKIERNKAFSKLEDAPQVVVYAKGGNINIDCGVKEIDAILIADGVIDTCYYDGKPLGDKDAEKELAKLGVAQTQLQINGAMYANTIKFNRTYGAATGANSIVPAEIVNYDNSMLFTGGSGGGTANGDGVMDVVYVRELAPRY